MATKTKLIGFCATPAMHELVRRVAQLEGVSMSEFARRILTDAAAERLMQLEAAGAAEETLAP